MNCYDVFDCNTPFGGFKSSGIGRELGPGSVNNYLENKTVIVARDEETLPWGIKRKIKYNKNWFNLI